MIGFASKPPLGLAISIDGQRSDLIGFQPHVRADQAETELAVWKAACAECGADFTAMQPALRMPQTRRCIAHRKPGKRVASA